MATLAGKKVITVSEVSQEIDLKRYLKRDATDSEKQAFIEVAIERINNRTLDGKTIHGGKFKKYSKEYAAEKGVTPSSVDLFLKGGMLGALEGEFDTNTNKISIEIEGELEVKKGFNHHTGDTQKKRPWFGITTKEAQEIANSIKQEDVQEQLEETSLADILGVQRITDETTEIITEETLASIISGITLEIDL